MRVVPSLGQLGAERAVLEALDNREHRVRLHSPDKIRAALRERSEQLVAPTEAPAGEHEHARADRGGERCGDGVLPIARRSGARREHRMRAALGEGDEANLGESRLSAPGVVAPEGSEVARRVRDVEDGAVHRHEPPVPVLRTLGCRGGERTTGALEQRFERFEAVALARF